MSANDTPISASLPSPSSAHPACSRLEPEPKFWRVIRMRAPSYAGLLTTKSGSLRHASNAIGP